MTLTYQTATDADILIIFQLAKDLINTYEDLSSIDYDKVLAWVSAKIDKNIHQYTRVEIDGIPCAYYRLCADGELDDLYVLAPYQNRGIGSKILQKLIHQTQQTMYLYVFSKNTGAIRFYERHGFLKTQQVGNTRLIMSLNG